MKRGHRPHEDHERCAGYPRDAFARQHQRQHHEQLLPERQRNAARLRHEYRRHRQIERAAVEVERIAGRHDERDDAARHADGFHPLHRLRQCRFGRCGREGDQRRLLHGGDECANRDTCQASDRIEHEESEGDEGDVQRHDNQAQAPQLL